MVHQFNTSLTVEARWAPVLDAWLSRTAPLREATRDEKFLGIDRFWQLPGAETTVEYKCDEVAARTGNIFVEIISNDRTGRPGWALTCQAEWLLYFIPPGKVLVFLGRKFKQAIGGWAARFPTRRANNGSYASEGVIVPVTEALAVACQVVEL